MPELEADDISKDLEAAFASASQSTSGDVSPSAPSDSAPPSADVPAPSAPADARARDEQGRFAKTEVKTEKPAAAEKKSDAPAETATGAQAQAPKPAVDPLAQGTPQVPTQNKLPAPQHWKGKGKVEWDRLTVPLQKEISDDYARMSKTETELQQIQSVIGDRAQKWALQYGSAENGLRAILAGSDLANQNPIGFLQWFIQRSGIDPRQLIQGGAQGQQQPVQDAQNPLAQQFVQLQNTVTQLQQQLQQNQISPIEAEIESFRNDPAHPYYNDVEPHMMGLLQAGKVPGATPRERLHNVYEMAVWAHPEARQSLLEKERQSVIDANAEKVAAAKRAAGGPTGSPAGGSMPPDEPNEDLEATLRRHANRLLG